MDKMREEFEEWAILEGLPLLFLDKHNFYESHVTDIAWQAWQASRQSLVVELPKVFDAAKEDASYYEYAYLQPEVEKALDAAGVAYK